MTPTPWQSFDPTPNALDRKRILITGAGSGIGACLARTCAAHGAEVLLLGRNQARLEEVYDGIVAAGGIEPGICMFDLNVAEEEAYEQLADQVYEAGGAIDGLVHNAAMVGQVTPIANYRGSTWNQVMQVNLNAAFLLTKAMLPLLQEREWARILFTSSTVGHEGRAFWGAYAASKFALEGLTQVLADELEGTGGTTVNIINPRATRTRLRATSYPAEDPASVPLPETIMPTYLYFLSGASGTLNGSSIDAR